MSRARHAALRTGVALLLNTVATGARGFGYWILAARLFPAGAVGRAGALISAVTLFASVGQLNLSGALMRFLPVAGRRSRSLVRAGYGFAAAASALLAAAVLAGFAVLAPAGAPLRVTGVPAVALVLASAATAVFALQDSVLVGLRHSAWVPAASAAAGVARIALLIAVAAGVGTWAGTGAGGIVAAAALPMVVLIPAVNLALFRRVLPAAGAGTGDGTGTGPPGYTRPAVLRFVAGDAAAGLFTHLWTYLLPVLVAGNLGSVANAHFYAAFLLSGALDLVAVNLAASLTVEAAHEPARLAELGRATLVHALALVVPLALVAAVTAPWILRWYGPRYTAGAPVLQLLALATVPRCVLVVYQAVARVQRHNDRAALLQGGVCVAVLAGTLYATTGHSGLSTVGTVVLAAHLAAAVPAAVLLVPALRRPPGVPAGGAVPATRPAHRATRDVRAAAVRLPRLRRIRPVPSTVDDLGTRPRPVSLWAVICTALLGAAGLAALGAGHPDSAPPALWLVSREVAAVTVAASAGTGTDTGPVHLQLVDPATGAVAWSSGDFTLRSGAAPRTVTVPVPRAGRWRVELDGTGGGPPVRALVVDVPAPDTGP